ncbi:Beta-(1,2)-xylosyltransferase, partial [Cucurbita argyrosperma subsp. argyrosperma]
MNGKTQALLLKILFLLFAFNTLTLCIYFTAHYKTSSSSSSHRKPTSENRFPFPENRRSSKPWPILPSYLPWSHSSTVPLRSCEAYFGNGFNRRVDLLKPNLAGKLAGWFRCWYSETLASSICEGARVRMWPERISMSRGGERIEEVIGRKEETELPKFRNGAFELDGGDTVASKERVLADEKFLNGFVPAGEIQSHTMRALFGSFRVVSGNDFDCQEWIEEPVLLVTRFEYANLFHTITDWYSAYVSSRVVGLPNRPHLVFVDGHCKTPLEETWKALFSSLKYAKNFSTPVCFRHVIFSPLGYETALFKGLTEGINCHGGSSHELWLKPDIQKTARLSEFGEMVRAAFGFPVDRQVERPPSIHNVLFVRREDYLAHPRHGGRVESRLTNEQEIFDSLQNWASNHRECKVNLVNGLFAHMSMKEQLRAIQDASVIIGAHGAGLTHIISALPKTVILEIISSLFRRPHFALIAQWKGLEYHAINLSGSHADPNVVIEHLLRIMTSLGC